jgi:hypothetical protein
MMSSVNIGGKVERHRVGVDMRRTDIHPDKVVGAGTAAIPLSGDTQPTSQAEAGFFVGFVGGTSEVMPLAIN